MDNPAIFLASGLFGSVTPNTVRTKMNPKKNSTPNPCNSVKYASFTVVFPSPDACRASGVIA